MNKNLQSLGAVLLPACAALALASCAYDPSGYGYYPSSPAVGSVFVATASSDWGYDPYRYCYYSYSRRAYYDPWLNGYYPVGYCPPPLAGCPHPYGWRPGHGVCPPPSGVHDRWIDRYQDRLAQIKASNYAWAANVRYQRQNAIEAQRYRNQSIREAQSNWAEQTRANRQHAIEVQRDRNQAIRDAQQAWANKVRGKQSIQPAQQVVPPPPPPSATGNWTPQPKAGRLPPARDQRYVPSKNKNFKEVPPDASLGVPRGKAANAPWLSPVTSRAPVQPTLRRDNGGAMAGGSRFGGVSKQNGGALTTRAAQPVPPPPRPVATSVSPAPQAKSDQGKGGRYGNARFGER